MKEKFSQQEEIISEHVVLSPDVLVEVKSLEERWRKQKLGEIRRELKRE